MANSFKYSYPGPPFNFLGTFSETQKEVFKSWLNVRLKKFPAIQQAYQIRATQLRKTAGVLEEWYRSSNDEILSPTFDKASWQPGPHGHFVPAPRNDHMPMVVTSEIKKYYKEQLNRQDEAVFHMNHLRNLIEKNEDKAQYAKDAVTQIPILLQEIESLFAQKQYQAVLVKDKTENYPQNSKEPYFRVHPLDTPTTWELEQHNRSTPGAPIDLKFVDRTF